MIYKCFIDSSKSSGLTRDLIYEIVSNNFLPQTSRYVWDGNILTEEAYTKSDTFIQLLDDTFETYSKTGLWFEWLETRIQLYKKFCSRQIPARLVYVELCKHQCNGHWLYLYRLT